MSIKIKKVKDGAEIPTLATSGSAAYDVYVPEDVIVKKGRNVIPLGFCMELPQGLAAEIHPRSGYAAKGMEGYEIICKTADAKFYINETVEITPKGEYVSLESSRFAADVIYGLIDEDFRGEVGVIINNRANTQFLVKKGTRIAQLLIVAPIHEDFEEATELSVTDRKGGFGSTN